MNHTHTHAHRHHVGHPHGHGHKIGITHTHAHEHTKPHDDSSRFTSIVEHRPHAHSKAQDPGTQAQREWAEAASKRGLLK